MKTLSIDPHFLDTLGLESIRCPNMTVAQWGAPIDGVHREKLIVVGEKANSPSLIDVFLKQGILHYFSKNGISDAQRFRNIANLVCFKNLYFDCVEQLLLKAPLESQKILFSQKQDKDEVIAFCDGFLSKLKSSLVQSAVRAIVEELFMNAAYDAPREFLNAGKTAEARGSSELILAHDGETILISALDHYGSLNSKKFMQRLQDVMIEGGGIKMNMDSSKGGAGIGCRILFENCDSLFLGVERFEKTRVSCLLPLNTSNKKFLLIKKSLHIIGYDGA